MTDKSNSIEIGLTYTEDNMNDIVDAVMSNVKSQIESTCRNHISASQQMNHLVENLLNHPLKGLEDSGAIDSFSVDIMSDSPEMEVVREVLEQPLDVIHANVSLKLAYPVNYISYSFLLDDSPCPDAK